MVRRGRPGPRVGRRRLRISRRGRVNTLRGRARQAAVQKRLVHRGGPHRNRHRRRWRLRARRAAGRSELVPGRGDPRRVRRARRRRHRDRGGRDLRADREMARRPHAVALPRRGRATGPGRHDRRRRLPVGQHRRRHRARVGRDAGVRHHPGPSRRAGRVGAVRHRRETLSGLPGRRSGHRLHPHNRQRRLRGRRHHSHRRGADRLRRHKRAQRDVPAQAQQPPGASTSPTRRRWAPSAISPP